MSFGKMEFTPLISLFHFSKTRKSYFAAIRKKRRPEGNFFNKDEKKLHRLTWYIWLQKNDSIKKLRTVIFLPPIFSP
jgi:hypothetical protein